MATKDGTFLVNNISVNASRFHSPHIIIMGIVFGKVSAKEPPFEVVLERRTVPTPYELRKYGTRYAASVEYVSAGADDTSTPFGLLAKYIGVFGTPQNEGSGSIAMTAPVIMEQKPKPIAMTAPVVMENMYEGKMMKMMFMLPAEYDDISKIPKPTNPDVHIEELPPEVGAVHRYNGNYNSKINREKATEMAAQLISDGVVGITEEYVLENFQFWGYNPPYCIPRFRRNEVWLKLSDEQINCLKEKTYK